MSVDLRKSLLASPVILGLVLAAATTVKAESAVPQIDLASQPTSVSELSNAQASNFSQAKVEVDENGNPIPQVTSVSQLSDVQPTDWAFQALQSLVERYGCIAGYPDGTFRGNRAATRYELAAALNSCLDQLSARVVTKEDVAAIRALQDEFAAELANLRGQIDSLEARTAELEANQFSTTTKLNGEAVFGIVYADVDRRAVPSPGEPTTEVEGEKPFFANRLRLNLDTSFTGKDRLRTRLQARNIPNLTSLTGTSMSRLGFDGLSSSITFPNGNVVELARLEYRFPVTDKGTAYIEAIGGEFNDNVNTFNPFFESSARGALSRFGRFNPIYRLSGDTGATFSYKLVNEENFKVTADVGYLAGLGPTSFTYSAGNPLDPGGLIGAPYGALAQIGIQPFKRLQLGFTYVHSNDIGTSGSTGSGFAENPFGGNIRPNTPGQINNPLFDTDIEADSFGAQASFLVNPKLNIAGWVGYTRARATDGPNNGADAEILNYAATVALPDLLREGDLIGLIFGQPPKVIDTNVPGRDDLGTSYHAEAFYRFKVNDNITVTPGVYAIINPEHNNNNDTVFVGVLRTTFVF